MSQKEIKEKINKFKGYLGEIEEFINLAPADKRKKLKESLDGLKEVFFKVAAELCPTGNPKVIGEENK